MPTSAHGENPAPAARGAVEVLLGILKRNDAFGRVHLLLDLFGRSAATQLRGEALMPAT